MAGMSEGGSGASQAPSEEIRLEEQVPSSPRDYLVQQEDFTDNEYHLGTLGLLGEDLESCAIIAIGLCQGKLLVGVPESVWHRSLSKRRRPPKALSKAVLVAVVACTAEKRLHDEDIVASTKLWIGLLDPQMEKEIDFTEGLQFDHHFGLVGPTSPTLANEHFGFVTAESEIHPGHQPKAVVPPMEERMQKLEESLEAIRGSLASLAGGTQGGAQAVPLPAKKENKRNRSNYRSSSSTGWYPREPLGGDVEDLEVETPEAGRCTKERGLEEGHHWWSCRGERGRRRRGWRARTYPRRQWICRPQRIRHLGDSCDSTHRHCQEAHRGGLSEGSDRSDLRRRWWIGRSWRKQFPTHFSEELCCPSSLAEMFAGGSQVHLPDSGGQSSRRLLGPGSNCWRTSSGGDYSERMADQQKSGAELPACEMVLGSWRSLGCPHRGSTGGGQSEVCTDDVRSRSGFYRWRKLAHVDGGAFRTSPTLSAVCPPHSSHTCRSSTLSSLRPKVGRNLPHVSEGDRLFRGCQEEAGKQRTSQERQGGGCSSTSSSRCKGQSQSREVRESEGPTSWRLRGRRRPVKVEPQSGPFQTGEGYTEDTSQSVPIQLPGARASTFTGASTFHSMMRSLFSCRCRLGAFAKSFAAQRFGEPIGSTAEADLFPMPLPYPEVFQQRRSSVAEDVALKKFVVMAVIVLNYLHLNRPRSITSVLEPRQKLSKRQWEGVRRLESYARAWIEVSPIGPEEMGRTAAKVESLEEVISQLETEAATISESNSYFGQARRTHRDSRASALRFRCQQAWPPSRRLIANGLPL